MLSLATARPEDRKDNDFALNERAGRGRLRSVEMQEEESDLRALRGFCGLIMLSSQCGASVCFHLHTRPHADKDSTDAL